MSSPMFSFFVLFLTFFYSFGNVLGGRAQIPAKKLWTSGVNQRFADMTLDQMKQFLGARQPSAELAPLVSFEKSTSDQNDSLPDWFDARDKWSRCRDVISTIRDQAHCGSCWAVATAAVLTDLTCIGCNASSTPYLSDEDLLSCCPDCGGNTTDPTPALCNGGWSDRGFNYWNTTGLVSGSNYLLQYGCMPYSIPPNSILEGQTAPQIPQCSNKCQPSSNENFESDKHKGQNYGNVKGEADMKAAIYNYGPIAVGSFAVYHDFQKEYTGGIYHTTPTSGQVIGYHSAKVIGWGSDNGVPYWSVVNSWGTNWGNNGTYKMRRGTNECGFEDGAIWGVSSADSCFFFKNKNDNNTTTTTTTTSTTSTTTTTTTTRPKAAHKSTQSNAVVFGLIVIVALCKRYFYAY